MEFGRGSFVEMEWPYFLFIFFIYRGLIKYSMPGANQHMFYAP